MYIAVPAVIQTLYISELVKEAPSVILHNHMTSEFF